MDKGGEMKTDDTYPIDLSESDIQWIKATEAEYAKTVSQFPLEPKDDFGNGLIQGIKHARAENGETIGITYYQIACETIRDQAERIKELEAANAKLMDEFDKNITTLGQYLFYPHPKELMAEIERLKSSPVSVNINQEQAVSIPARSPVQYLREYHNDLRDKSVEYSEDARNNIHLNNSMFFRGKAEAYSHAAKKLQDIFNWLDIKI